MRERLLAYVNEKGTLLEPDAVTYLLAQENPLERLEHLFHALPSPPLIITMGDVIHAEGIARAAATRAQDSVGLGTIAASFRRRSGRASEDAPRVQILRDVTGQSTCVGTVEDFMRYFRNRFEGLTRILRARRELAGAQEIAKAKRSAREVRLLGMVSDVRATRNGHRIVDVEDETDRVSVLVPSDSAASSEFLVRDEVLGIVGTVNERGLVIAKSVLLPEASNRRTFPAIADHIRIAFLSDIHVGSKAFLSESWARFASWMRNGHEVARSIRYLVLSGDVVDGIGVYPNQDGELAVDDVYAQYESLAGLLAELPDHVSIVLIPGNHDAVRPAEPQPALPTSIQKLFHSNVTFVGNPCSLQIEGVRILAYHGRSMDDLVSAIPGTSYHRPLELMKAMLRMRHVAPIYGEKTPIAPEAQDFLIIDEVPDVFVTGHVHSVGVDQYRGVVLVNASTWQAQTSYQKMRNIEPVPARVPILDLATGQTAIKAF